MANDIVNLLYMHSKKMRNRKFHKEPKGLTPPQLGRWRSNKMRQILARTHCMHCATGRGKCTKTQNKAHRNRNTHSQNQQSVISSHAAAMNVDSAAVANVVVSDSFGCDICGIAPCWDEYGYQQHLISAYHAYYSRDAVPTNEDGYLCLECNLMLGSAATLRQHRAGAKHRRRALQLQNPDDVTDELDQVHF